MANLIQVRDAVARDEAIGPRILAAGNIVGWGGQFLAREGNGTHAIPGADERSHHAGRG